MSENKNEVYIEEEITLYELADRFLDVQDMKTPETYDLENLGIEVLSFDKETNKEVYKPLTHFVVKEGVKEHFKSKDLKGTSEHLIMSDAGEFITLSEDPDSTLVIEPIDVVDITVADTHNYIANGHVNHNTVPGGLAIPFHASVRIKLGSGKHIVAKDGKDERVIGINVSAKTIKNKVSPPFRSCEFEIHFGVGIKEHQQVLDLLREYGPAEIASGRVCVEGDGAWKTFWLDKDGKRIKEIKFTKNGFEEHLYSKELSPIFDEYIEAVMTSKFKKLIDIDPESYSEVEALSHEVSDNPDALDELSI